MPRFRLPFLDDSTEEEELIKPMQGPRTLQSVQEEELAKRAREDQGMNAYRKYKFPDPK
jgi:hypothetical protein